MDIDINFMIAGEAGQGVQSAGFLLAKVFARMGYHVFADQDYESRIRGGHNFFRIRVKTSQVRAIAEPIDILITLNKEGLYLHQNELADNGVIIFDGEKGSIKDNGGRYLAIPLEKMALEITGNKLMLNTVALGAALGMVGCDFETFEEPLKGRFAGETGMLNMKAARAGYDYVKNSYKGDFGYCLMPVAGPERMLLNGNEAIALGAMAAGCKFVAAYPMTPATPIMEYIASKAKDFGLVVIQPEDEIAAINMVIGASYAGVRAMTATSGGGFSLMVEGLSLAGMTETPAVVVLGQRPGPAIGLPTRTEQGELEFAIHAGHGEFPRAVLAPATIEDAFWLTTKAFNLAERYQTPVILLTDHHLATSYATTEKFDTSKVTIDRGVLFSGTHPSAYRRHAITDSGISPRAFPLQQEGILVVTDADEHNEEGHLIEDAETRTKMVEKRMRKLQGLKSSIEPPQIYGPDRADLTLIGWGSTYGALCEAVNILLENGASVNLLHLKEIWPFPDDKVSTLLGDASNCCVVENNATGQLAHLLRAETGIACNHRILKYDGRPFTPAYLVREIKKVLR